MKLILIATGDFSDFTNPSVINTLNLARVANDKYEVLVLGKFKKRIFRKKSLKQHFLIEKDLNLILIPYYSKYFSFFVSFIVFPIIIFLTIIKNYKSEFQIISRSVYTTIQLLNFKKYFLKKIRIIHDWHLSSKRKNLIKIEKKIINSNLIKSVFISESLRKFIFKKYNIINKKLDNLAPDASLTFREAKDQLNSKEVNLLRSGKVFSRFKERVSFCYVGSDKEGKGVDLIIQAANKLPEYDFYLFGKIKKNITLKNKNIFFKGTYSNRLLICGIRIYDAFLLPNKAEQIVNKENIGTFTSPLKLFDYMTTKKPIISSNLKNLLEILPKGKFIEFEQNNLKSFMKALKCIHIGIDNRKYNLSKLHLENYTWNKRLENLLSN